MLMKWIRASGPYFCRCEESCFVGGSTPGFESKRILTKSGMSRGQGAGVKPSGRTRTLGASESALRPQQIAEESRVPHLHCATVRLADHANTRLTTEFFN